MGGEGNHSRNGNSKLADEELLTSLWVAEITNCIKQLCKEKQLGWQMLTWAYFRAMSDFSY
ncbi:hypothetical protein T4B_3184 [Trichinella pseudospiralis]|uniref:Uncharacterized protein n=1 Tax=Trichinella pseudospiralis TaxID=6337 RepID=A0A0V1IVF2_TRIPS|nr:hypothetical protein T4B_3184 [Trichinella pseudospiralis]KRZ44716.1 hypothetical protein T4C_5062 [Trichinella pseudospiralis]